MKTSRRALILIDLQYDFMPGGALAVARGDEVVAVANRLMRSHDLVVATQDWHPADHKSFASQHEGKEVGEVIDLDGLPQVMWPDHCVQGTRGARIVEELDTRQIAAIFRKGMDPEIDSYSGFYDNGHRRSTGMAGHLRELGVETLDVMGLATDYCVKYTVLDALEEGFAVNLVLEGCRGVGLGPTDIEQAIEQMRDAGASIVK